MTAEYHQTEKPYKGKEQCPRFTFFHILGFSLEIYVILETEENSYVTYKVHAFKHILEL